MTKHYTNCLQGQGGSDEEQTMFVAIPHSPTSAESNSSRLTSTTSSNLMVVCRDKRHLHDLSRYVLPSDAEVNIWGVTTGIIGTDVSA